MKTATTANPCCRRCGKRHQGWRTIAACRWPTAIWITGTPPADGACYASVSSCPGYRRSGPTVILFATKEKAEQAKRVIDGTGCGGGCCRMHAVIELTRDGGRVKA